MQSKAKNIKSHYKIKLNKAVSLIFEITKNKNTPQLIKLKRA
jgi:hypothetical protein